MSVASHCNAENGVVYCMGGFEDGSVLVWDTRSTYEELARLKLFSEPGRVTIKIEMCGCIIMAAYSFTF